MSFITSPIGTIKKAIRPALYIGAGAVLGIGGKLAWDGRTNQRYHYYPIQSTQSNNPQIVINLNVDPVDLVSKVESFLSNPELVKQSISDEKVRNYAKSFAHIANVSLAGAYFVEKFMKDKDVKLAFGTRYKIFMDEFRKDYTGNFNTNRRCAVNTSSRKPRRIDFLGESDTKPSKVKTPLANFRDYTLDESDTIPTKSRIIPSKPKLSRTNSGLGD